MLSLLMPVRVDQSTEPLLSGLEIGADERHQEDVGRAIDRNRDALNVSIRRSRDEIERGVWASRTIGDIIADGRNRHGAG